MTFQKYLCYCPILVCALCATGLAQALTFVGKVTHVSDGDTVWVRTAENAKPRKLRLQGIDAPESCQTWGPQASAALSARVQGQFVVVDSSARDDYGRLLGRIRHRGDDVARWMVLDGHAWSYRYRHSPGPYATEQAQAQGARRGLWASAAVEPREFRTENGSCPRP